MADEDGIDAPGDEDNDHNGRDLHDPHGFLAGFVDALDVVPPEINGAEDGEKRGAEIGADVETEMNEVCGFIEKADDVLPGGHAADRTGQNVVEHQGGNAEFGDRAAHGFFDDAINAATDEHAAAFDVDRADRVRKQHDAEDEPRSGLADVAFGLTTGIVSGGSQIVENDSSRAPKGDEREKRSGRDKNARYSVTLAASGGRALRRAAHGKGKWTCRFQCSHFLQG